jgi:hypothetical protein
MRLFREFEWSANKKNFFNGSYQITTIDSLGNYLDVFYNYVNTVFKLEKDKFTMTCPPGGEYMTHGDDTFGAIFIEMNVKFPQKVYGCSYNAEKFNMKHSVKKL